MDDGEMPGTKPNPGEAKQRKAHASFLLFGGLAIKWASGPCFSTASTVRRDMLDIGRHGGDDGYSDDNSAWTTRFPVLPTITSSMHPFPA